MFTVNTQRTLRKIGVKMKSDAPAATPTEIPEVKSARQALHYFNEYKTHSSDSIRLAKLLDNVQSAIDTLAKNNQFESKKIETELTQAIAAEENKETKKILEDLQNKRIEEINVLNKKKEAATSTVQNKTAADTATAVPANAPVVSASGATKPDKMKAIRGYSTVVGRKEQADALGQILNVDAKNSNVIAALKDTDIGSVLGLVNTQPESALRGYIDNNWNTSTDLYNAMRNLGYSSNGTFGVTELGAVKDFIQYYIASIPVNKFLIKEIAQYTNAGLATTVARNSMAENVNLTDTKSVITYLTNLPDARFQADAVAKVLNTRKDQPDFAIKLAHVIGSNAIDMTTLVADLKARPELKARFYENINTAGANQSSTLGALLDGKGAEQATEKANKITEILKQKTQGIRTDLQRQVAASQDPTEKAKIEAVLAEYDKKGDAWFTGEIRKVAEGAFVNIGKNANSAGAGMSFETFVRGLTVNAGVGFLEGGKVGAALVVHYNIASSKLTETDKKIIEGSIGVGTSVFPAVIPFVDGSLKATDKISVYGAGVGGIDSVGLNAMLSKGGGTLSLAFLNERKSEIDQGTVLMNKVIDQFSSLKAGDITADKVTEIVISQKGMSITPTEAINWTKRLVELYRVNRVTDATPVEAKAILIKGVVESEGEKKHTGEAMNDTDARSYKGFSVGVGHLFGITFPLVGLYFKEGKIQYQYPEMTNKETKGGANPISTRIVDTPKTEDTTETKKPILQNPIIATDVLAYRAGITPKLAGSIYVMSRKKTTYPLFDSAMVKAGSGDYEGAISDLKRMTKSQVAKDILEVVGQTPEKMGAIATFRYGALDIKNISGPMSQEQYLKARNKKSPDGTVASENKLSPGNTAAEAFFETKTSHAPKDLKNIYPGQDIASLVYATPKGGTHTIDRYPGSVTVSEYIYTGAVLDSQKNLLITRHTAAIAKNLKALNDQFKLTITPEQYTNILKTGVVPNELTQKGLALDKNPQFIEARAMIKDKNGNVCANRTEAIIFPTFSFTETIIIPGQPAKYKTITQNVPSPSTYDPDVGGAGFEATEVASGLIISAAGERKDEDTEQVNYKTEIKTTDVQVGPNNIQTVNGNRVIVVNTGGTQTNISLASLSRDQAIALRGNQNITIRISTNVQVPVLIVTPGQIYSIPNLPVYSTIFNTTLVK